MASRQQVRELVDSGLGHTEAVPDSERERLGRRIEAAAKRGPARPHRRASRKPAAAAAVKAAAVGASADRAHDAVSHRRAEREGSA